MGLSRLNKTPAEFACVWMEPNRNRHVVRQPFGMPASTYYFLASAGAIGVFFLLWAIFNELREETPWIPAGLLASALLISLGLVRELAQQSARRRAALERRRIEPSVFTMPIARRAADPDKLTLERNAAFLGEIQRRSDAAKVLSSISASHREVFELCEDYLDLVEKELPNVAIGSPRLRPISKGREYASRFHRYHMLKWAECSARELIQFATMEPEPEQKLRHANETLGNLETALSRYPEDTNLQASDRTVREIIASVKARLLLEKAKNAKEEAKIGEAMAFMADAGAAIFEGEILSGGENSIFADLQDELTELEEDLGSNHHERE